MSNSTALPFLYSPDFITVVCQKPHTIYSNDHRYGKLLAAIKDKQWDLVPQIVSLPKAISLFSFGKVKIFEGQVMYKDKPLHNSVTERILEFIREGFPFESLVRFLDNLMENPTQSSIEMVFEYLQRYKMPIGDDGAVYGMKAIKANYTDKWTGKINNKPGQYNKMPREEISCDPDCAFGPGFHHGFEDFVRDYGSGDDRVVLTKFFPKDVCRIPVDACYQKIVVSEYEVVADLGTVKDFGNFSSNYAPNSNVSSEFVQVDNEEKARQVEGKDWETVSADKAYKLHREGGFGLISFQFNGNDIIYQEPKRPRSFFRKYNDWVIA